MAGNMTSKGMSWTRSPSRPIATSRESFVIRLILVEKWRASFSLIWGCGKNAAVSGVRMGEPSR